MASTYGTPGRAPSSRRCRGPCRPRSSASTATRSASTRSAGSSPWHYGAYFALLAGLWSILALSSTLAGEAKRGSLEFVAVTPRSRRVLALEKLAAHVTAVVVVDDDRRPPDVGDRRRLRQVRGRRDRGRRRVRVRGRHRPQGDSSPGRSRSPSPRSSGVAPPPGIAGGVMLAGYLLNSYRIGRAGVRRAREPRLVRLDPRAPAARGRFDWPSLALVALVAVVLFAVGIEAFARTRHRGHRGHQDARGCRGSCSASGGRSTARSASPCLRPRGGASAWGCTGSSWRCRARVHRGAAALAGSLRGVHGIVPGMDLATVARVPAVRVHRHGPAARRPGGGDVRRGLVLRRDRAAASSCS